MKPAAKHPRENKRLEDLYNYEILDTLPEQKFDQITKLASAICGTPMALVSFVDQDRQWFKSKVGLEADQTSRDEAFCAHAILQDQIFEVSDASRDMNFKDHPQVEGGLKVRFYAGAPLINSNGLPMGTLCVIDSKPKELTKEQKDLLSSLAGQVMDVMELRLKNKQLQKANAEIKLRQEQLLNLSRKHHINYFSSGVWESLETPVRELTEIIIEEGGSEIIEKRLNTIKNVLNSLQKMATWQHKEEKELFNVTDVIETFLAVTRPYCSQRNIRIESMVDKRISLRGDPNDLSQVLIHLFQNSAQALENILEKKEKVITINFANPSSGIELHFIDNGVGIHPNKREALFKPFSGGKSSDQLGLGLYMARSLMLKNGGDLLYEDGEPETRFVIKIPTAF